MIFYELPILNSGANICEYKLDLGNTLWTLAYNLELMKKLNG